jgi:hypothetical protein
MGAVGDTRIRVVRMEAAVRIALVAEERISVADGPVAAGDILAAGGVVADSGEDGRRVPRRWRGRVAAVEGLVEALTVAGLRARRADIRRVVMVEGVTDDRGTDTAADMVAAVGRAIRTAATAARADLLTVTVETRAAITALLAVGETAAATRTHTEIRAAVMERRRIVATPATVG